MAVVDLDDIQEWVIAVLLSTGLTTADAGPVAASLAFAEARGISTHGLLRLSTYIERIHAGGINKAAQIRTEVDLGGLVVLDADHAPGARSAVYGCDVAVARARDLGIGCVIARNSSHFGASAFYTNRIADQGMLGLALCNTEPVMCAPSGGSPVLGTNPISVAVPLPSDQRPQLDMATTTVSQGKLLIAAQAGESIPLGWAVDADAQPTTSPSDGLRGALLPSGGPKGFGLGFAVDALLALAGGQVSPGVSPLNGDASQPQRVGHLFVAIRADAAVPASEYRERIQHLVEAIHNSGADDTAAPPLAPGEPELARARQTAGRLELGHELLKRLRVLADEAGVPLPGETREAGSAEASIRSP